MHPCSCGCCCCSCTTHKTAPQHAPPSVTPTPPPPKPQLSVDLKSVRIRPFIVGGSMSIDAYFEWSATGAPNLKVAIQVKSPVTFQNWRDLLSNQPPVDVGQSPLWGVPGETPFWFRAVATDKSGNTAYSQIITVR